MKQDINHIKDLIKQMQRPLKGIPLADVIESLAGFAVIPFNLNYPKDKAVLLNLTKAAEIAKDNINKNGVLRSRPNEVGNAIESFVKDSLNSIGYQADTPTTIDGNKKTTGYPDIEFVDEFGRTSYLECKTYNKVNISTTQRSFYLSPSEDFKVTKDAHHLVMSFEIYVDGRVSNKNIYRCKSWKIVDVSGLEVDVKYEFNSDNRRLYMPKAVLAHR
jgi:hypothetical protein